MLSRLQLVCCVSLVVAAPSFGAFVSINTSNAGEVALFQAGATVETFDSLTGQATLTDGTPIAAASQLDNQLKAGVGVFFTSGGNTPIAVLNVAGIGIAHSGTNVVAPLAINTDQLCATDPGCFMEIFFTGTNNKFGGWFQNGDVQAIIFWTDSTSDAVNITKGNFGGGVDTAKTIDHVTLLFSAGGSGARTLDDLTFAGTGSTTVPEPGTTALLGGGLLALGYFRKRSARG